jgi:hypothetical protein
MAAWKMPLKNLGQDVPCRLEKCQKSFKLYVGPPHTSYLALRETTPSGHCQSDLLKAIENSLVEEIYHTAGLTCPPQLVGEGRRARHAAYMSFFTLRNKLHF